MNADRKPVRKGALLLYLIISLVLLAVFGGYMLLDKYYPLAQEQLIKEYAEKHGLSESLVYGVIATESKFDADAVSKRGAVGLMQIMPDTGEWIAGKLGIEGFESAQLKDAEINIRIGTWYLEYLSDRYDGSEFFTIAAYNAGHGRVDEWIADGTLNAGSSYEDIPYEETANYVKKVERALEIYKTVYSID